MAANNQNLPFKFRTITTRVPIDSDTGGMETETIRTGPNGQQSRRVVRETPVEGKMGGKKTEVFESGDPDPAPTPGGNPFTRSAGFVERHTPEFRSMTNVPRGIPRFLGSRQILFVAWIAAMILVSSDEFNTGFIFPRPARLWYTSSVYFFLFIASQADAMVPVCNALGIGYVMALLYENVSGNSLELFGIKLSGATAATTTTAG